MSYEGHEQCICTNGHYFVRDHDDPSENVCHICKAPFAWSNSVDDTNGDADGLIPYTVLKEKFHLEDGEVKVCDLGHTHLIKEETFRIPTPEETEAMRTYGNDEG